MGAGRTISQEAFEEVVKENIDDLDMDPDEALQDAIETLTLQGVDLSGNLSLKNKPLKLSYFFLFLLQSKKIIRTVADGRSVCYFLIKLWDTGIGYRDSEMYTRGYECE